jgi:hypothetical protein
MRTGQRHRRHWRHIRAAKARLFISLYLSVYTVSTVSTVTDTPYIGGILFIFDCLYCLYCLYCLCFSRFPVHDGTVSTELRPLYWFFVDWGICPFEASKREFSVHPLDFFFTKFLLFRNALLVFEKQTRKPSAAVRCC